MFNVCVETAEDMKYFLSIIIYFLFLMMSAG